MPGCKRDCCRTTTSPRWHLHCDIATDIADVMLSTAAEFVQRDVQGPLRRVPHWCNGASLSGDGSYTGEVVLCWGVVEQARNEHMSDEYKKQYIIDIPRSPS